jgi:ABC-type sugar transport system ATPase subunit
VRDLTIRYGEKVALQGATFEVMPHEIFGIIGPANSGKTSFLRVLNRMDTFNKGMQFTGDVQVGGKNVRAWRNLFALRRRIGVVFPLPVGLPLTIYDNVAFAPRLAGITRRGEARRGRRALPAPAPPSGTRSRTASTASAPALRRPAAAPHHRPRPLPPAPRSCCSTNSASPSIPSPPCASRTCSRSCAGT